MFRSPIAALAVCGLVFPSAASDAALASFIDSARGADIVVLGEIHDNPRHHEIQAEIVEALQPAAIVFEMIPQAMEDEVNALRAEGADRAQIAAALDWSESGWPSFDFYAPILEAAPGARIFGAGQAPEEIRIAAEDGAASAFGADAATYGLDKPLAPGELTEREELMAISHCNALPPAALPGMVEVQRFRDAGLADAALWARTLTGGDGQVVVITGSGHADRRWAVPHLISLATKEVTVRTLGLLEAPEPEPGMFDAVITADPAERDDPCAGFAAK
ncbi:ChaN family lipoprotein [Rhodobacteraceae bacterium DSL-40]|uniref:ChaN family lipoprotein n=1 Tax=Amaricoccus sp. B4 TaxID=3368557 RepID=UPI0013A6D19B